MDIWSHDCELSYDLPQVYPQASHNHVSPRVPWPAPLKYIIHDIMDVISECTYHPITPAGFCLKSSPYTGAAHLLTHFMTFFTDACVVE